MSNSIGSASLLIVPTFDGLTSKVNAALGSASTTASASGSKLGQSTASGFGKGLVSSGAVIGAFSSITSAAMSSISEHVGSAVARFDTLNNYPKVMESLGYSSKDADASISTMSDRLSTLPTRLDDMESTVQGIVAVTGDLDQATNAGLALNDMLLASGSNTQLVNAATEQFRQMLAKGKPELEDWKSLTQAMPGQMKQLAEEMLGAGHSAEDLYYALGGGKESDAPEGIEWASISMDRLLDTIIRLDQEGGDGITSFKEQAETAAGGISTSMDNLSNAVTKGISGVLDTVGKENISGVLGDMKTAVNDAFSVVNSAVSAAMPYVEKFYGVFKQNSGTILTAAASFGGLTVATDKVSGAFSKVINTNKKTKDSWGTVKSGASDLKTALGLLSDQGGTLSGKMSRVGSSVKTMGSGVKGVLSGLVSAIDPVSLAITGVTAAISVGIAAYEDWKQKAETMTKATDGLNDAVSRTAALSDYSGTVENVGKVCGTSAKSADDLAESIAKSVDTMNENTSKAETTIATLSTAQGIIEKYAGKTDLSTEAQGKLKWAIEQVNEQLGLSIDATNVANDSYTDQDGVVHNLTQSVGELTAAKKEQARVDALQANLTIAYQNQADAAKTFAAEQKKVNDAASEYQQKMKDANGVTISYEDAVKAVCDKNSELGKSYSKAKEELDASSASVSALQSELGRAGAAAEGVSDKLSTLADDKLAIVAGALSNTGRSSSDFAKSLENLGVSTETLANMSDEHLATLAADYDGTVTSIADDLREWGEKVYQVSEKSGEMAASISGSLGEVEGMGDTFDEVGWNLEEFARKCSEAGLTTEDFAGVSSEQFAAMAEACGGNMDEMITSIALYNSTPLVNKDGTVNVDDSMLIDAQGHVLVYNGTGLYDKTAQAYVDSATVQDSTGVVWEWDGTQLVSKDADATITGNAVTGDAQNRAENTQGAIDRLNSRTVEAQVYGNASDGSAASNIWNTVDSIANLAGKTVTNVVETIHRTIWGDAAGGIRPHADGGIRYHAGGAIVDRPGTGIPLDVVGEAGAEAIIPLTNKKYVTPFARAVAEQMAEVTGKDAATGEAIERVIELLSAILDKDTNTYLDGDKVSAALAARARYAMAGRGLA